jgi:L-amino acid N-acyltransferase YncA
MQDRMYLRAATFADLGAINDIFNHYVRTSPFVYCLDEIGLDERQEWFRKHGPAHPIWVATDGAQLLGWGSLSTFNVRGGYRHTVDDSVYVHPQHQRRGAGRALLARLVADAQALGHHAVIGVIDSENEVSVALHRQFGFEVVGMLSQVGHKFGRWRDVLYMQRLFEQR